MSPLSANIAGANVEVTHGMPGVFGNGMVSVELGNTSTLAIKLVDEDNWFSCVIFDEDDQVQRLPLGRDWIAVDCHFAYDGLSLYPGDTCTLTAPFQYFDNRAPDPDEWGGTWRWNVEVKISEAGDPA